MSVLLQICAVVVTIAIATIAVAAFRVMRHCEAASDEWRQTAEALRGALADGRAMMARFDELTRSAEGILPPLKRAVNRVEELGDRAMRLSNGVLNEVERPIRTTMAVLAGVRTGTRTLMDALAGRANRPQHHNGGSSHE